MMEGEKTLFMIHGMWGGPWYFGNFREFFESKGYRCVTPTLRYHDASPGGGPDPLLGTTGILDYADDLEREISALGEKPLILGHSMGGLLAQILGSRGLASGLVLLNPAPPAGIMALRPSVFRTFLGIMATRSFWKRPVMLGYRKAVYALFNGLPEEVHGETYGRFVHESGKAIFEIGLWLLDRRRASYVDEGRVGCPVLVTASKKDRITPVPVVSRIAEKYRRVSTFVLFENHAHWVPEEPGWEEVASTVCSWLAQQTFT